MRQLPRTQDSPARIDPTEGGSPRLSQIEGLPVGSRRSARFPAARRHRIVTLQVPYPIASPRRAFHFLDDQGHDCHLYVTESACVPSFRLRGCLSRYR